MPSTQVPSERVVIAIDPHKASWTAAAVNTALQPLATIRVPVSRQGYRQLRRFPRPLARRDVGDRGRLRSRCSAHRMAIR
jgi:hypothetical protein